MTAVTDEIEMSPEEIIQHFRGMNEILKAENERLKCCGNCSYFAPPRMLNGGEYCAFHNSTEHPDSLFLFSYFAACEYWDHIYHEPSGKKVTK